MRDNNGRFVKGVRNTNWKGGKNYDGQGYIRVWRPEHPFNNGGYVLEHRLVMENKLKRLLRKEEVIHHINGVKDDNRVENLELMTRHEHPANHHIGRPVPEEVKKKISKTLMGHQVSDKIRKAVSKKTRERYASGEKFGFQKGKENPSYKYGKYAETTN